VRKTALREKRTRGTLREGTGGGARVEGRTSLRVHWTAIERPERDTSRACPAACPAGHALLAGQAEAPRDWRRCQCRRTTRGASRVRGG